MRGADVNMRQMGSELKMLAAGLVLGRLVLRKPSAPAPVVVRITEPAPAPKPRRKRDLLTNNAVVAGVVSAIIAGGISFGVAHYQSQDAARQAQSTLQTQQAQKLEGVTLAVYQSLNSVYNVQLKCFDGNQTWRQCATDSPDLSSLLTDLNALGADGMNISDKTASKLAASFGSAVTAVYGASSEILAKDNWQTMLDQYIALQARCGQLIQGQT